MRETYYSHNDKKFFKYNANYKQPASEIIIRKYTLDTTKMVGEFVLNTSFTIMKQSRFIIFDNLPIQTVNKIFRDEVVYHDVMDIIPYVARAIRAEILDPSYEGIQDLIDRYPESFV